LASIIEFKFGGLAPVTLEELNRAEEPAFVAQLGGVFEHSPWVAERAWSERPFPSRDLLHAAMMRVVRTATREEQLALLRAHPELSGREAHAGALTADSSSEQGRLGFGALSPEEFGRMTRLNRAYRAKFGFPAIVALALHAKRDTVFAEIERRIGNDGETEIANGLGQVAEITRARLTKLIPV
jgi:OHCU decarboxylase